MNLRNPWLLLLLTAVLAAAAQLLLPWWSLAMVAFSVGFGVARSSGGVAFGIGFGGAALSWLLPAIWLNMRNNSLLAGRVAQLLPLGGSAAALLLLTGLVAGLAGGLAALAGAWLRLALLPMHAPLDSAPVDEPT